MNKIIKDFIEKKYKPSTNDKYHLKYLKYKQKYLELKAIKENKIKCNFI